MGRLVLGKESPRVVVASLRLGFHRSCVHDWLQRYPRHGECGLVTLPAPDKWLKFDDALWAEDLRDLISTSDSRQLDFHNPLSTRATNGKLPHRQSGVRVRERTLSHILKRLDITVQLPRMTAAEQDLEVVQRYPAKERPKLRARAKASAVVYFGDESNLHSNAHRGTTGCVKGEAVVALKTGRRFSRDPRRLHSQGSVGLDCADLVNQLF